MSGAGQSPGSAEMTSKKQQQTTIANRGPRSIADHRKDIHGRNRRWTRTPMPLSRCRACGQLAPLGMILDAEEHWTDSYLRALYIDARDALNGAPGMPTAAELWMIFGGYAPLDARRNAANTLVVRGWMSRTTAAMVCRIPLRAGSDD